MTTAEKIFNAMGNTNCLSPYDIGKHSITLEEAKEFERLTQTTGKPTRGIDCIVIVFTNEHGHFCTREELKDRLKKTVQ